MKKTATTLCLLIGAWLSASAQANINQYEYWFDGDFGGRVTTSVAPAANFTLNTGIGTASLDEGLHVLHLRFRDDNLVYSQVVSQFFQKINANLTGNDQINGYEYWFDNDFANRVTQSVLPQAAYTLNTGIPTAALDEGLHVFHVRFRDVGGNWSSTVSQFFQKINQNLTGNDQITGYEYWFDADYAARVQEAVPPQSLFQLNTAVATSQLDKGLHVVHVRFQNAGGQWSSTVSQFFQKLGEGVGPTNNIAAYRYWFDDMTGDVTEMTVGGAANPLYLIGNLNVSQLAEGQHTLNMQFRDELGQWSEVVIGAFNKLGEPRLDYITPNEGGNTGKVTVSMYGTGFYQGTTARLTRQGYTDIVAPADQTFIFGGERLDATFDLEGVALGSWNVQVEVPGFPALAIANGFEVVDGIPPSVTTNVIGPGAIRPFQWQSYSLIIMNQGNNDAEDVPVWLTVPPGVEVDLDFELTNPNNNYFPYEDLQPYVTIDNFQGADFDAKVYPFKIRNIPSQFSGELNYKIRATTTAPIEMRTWANPPTQEDAFECFDATASYILGSVIGSAYGCVEGSYEFGENLGTYIATGEVDVQPFLYNAATTFVDCYSLFNPAFEQVSTAVELFSGAYETLDLYDKCKEVLNPLIYNTLHTNVVTSFDPNEKNGPVGGGPQNFFVDDLPYNYAIHFENVDTATANAQTVLVLDTLDASVFDYSTFQLGDFNIADTVINVPPGRSQFQTLYPMIAEQNVVLRISASFDETTGIASWHFESLDPQTLEPVANPFDGFLPPNQTAPEGQGAVHYSVKVKPNLPINTVVRNTAGIYFDFNPPIITNTWQNTIDNIKPHSEVSNLAAVQSDTVFTVNWTGIDTSSGIKYYDVYVARNSGDYRLWLSNVNYTSATYTGQMDSTYSFYSVATDLAGNREEKPTTPDAMTTIMLTDVNEITLTTGKLTVYPNPVSDLLVVEGREFRNAEVQLALKDVYGRTLHTEKQRPGNGVFSAKINVSSLPSGFYWLTAMTGGVSFTIKICK